MKNDKSVFIAEAIVLAEFLIVMFSLFMSEMILLDIAILTAHIMFVSFKKHLPDLVDTCRLQIRKITGKW